MRTVTWSPVVVMVPELSRKRRWRVSGGGGGVVGRRAGGLPKTSTWASPIVVVTIVVAGLACPAPLARFRSRALASCWPTERTGPGSG
jgi:hypothetical protein